MRDCDLAQPLSNLEFIQLPFLIPLPFNLVRRYPDSYTCHFSSSSTGPWRYRFSVRLRELLFTGAIMNSSAPYKCQKPWPKEISDDPDITGYGVCF